MVEANKGKRVSLSLRALFTCYCSCVSDLLSFVCVLLWHSTAVDQNAYSTPLLQLQGHYAVPIMCAILIAHQYIKFGKIYTYIYLNY